MPTPTRASRSKSTDSKKSSAKAAAKPAPRKRVPAEERREDVLRAAAEVVAIDGMHAASTAVIAKRSGISHAYLFRLFPTKEALMEAVAGENGRIIELRMREAGGAAKAIGADPLVAMGEAWQDLLTDRTLLQVNLQGISASSNSPAIGAVMRAVWERVVETIERLSGVSPDEARAFVAQGTLLLVISGLGAEQSDWAARLHHGPLPCAPEQIDLTAGASVHERFEAAESSDAEVVIEVDAGADADEVEST